MNLKSLPKSLSLTSVLLLLASAPCVQATPYATSLTNNAGTVSFRLNEAADQVTIIGNGGDGTVRVHDARRGTRAR